MNRSDYFFIFFLFILAIFIWFRDIHWMSDTDDTLPILVAIPLFIWIGQPWIFKKNSSEMINQPIFSIATALFVVGIGLDMTFFLALGWTFFLWSWLSMRLEPSTLNSVKKLLILPIMAFPWITLDADRIGWWFRLSGAWTAAKLFSAVGFNVVQEGTNLNVNGLPISIEVACAGLNTLQSMVIAGTVVDYIILGNSSLYWWNLPILVIMAWIANTFRIIVISFTALIISPEFAIGMFHIWGGWLIILLMFILCWVIFSLQQSEQSKPSKL